VLDSLRKPPFILALVVALLIVLVEAPPGWFHSETAPGYGIPYMRLVDTLLLLTLALIGSSLLIGDRFQGRLQGIITLLVALTFLGLAFRCILEAVVELIIMLALLAAAPFGPAIYIGLFGSFDVSTAGSLLALLWFLKIALVVCLLLAQQRLPLQIGLLLLLVTSIVLNFLVGFLHGLVPDPLVSVTDAVAGIVLGIVGLIWALVFLIISIVAVVRALRLGTRRQQQG
jgi:hypothetical protein